MAGGGSGGGAVLPGGGVQPGAMTPQGTIPPQGAAVSGTSPDGAVALGSSASESTPVQPGSLGPSGNTYDTSLAIQPQPSSAAPNGGTQGAHDRKADQSAASSISSGAAQAVVVSDPGAPAKSGVWFWGGLGALGVMVAFVVMVLRFALRS
jgi:hypothetical protein